MNIEKITPEMLDKVLFSYFSSDSMKKTPELAEAITRITLEATTKSKAARGLCHTFATNIPAGGDITLDQRAISLFAAGMNAGILCAQLAEGENNN